jgi:hypothetical protein
LAISQHLLSSSDEIEYNKLVYSDVEFLTTKASPLCDSSPFVFSKRMLLLINVALCSCCGQHLFLCIPIVAKQQIFGYSGQQIRQLK